MILFKLGNICCESLLDYLILRMFIVFTLVVISYLLRRSPCNYLTLSRAILCDGEIYYDIVMCCVRGAHSSPCPLPLPANTVLLHVSRGDWQRTKHPAGDSNTNMDRHLVTTEGEDGGSQPHHSQTPDIGPDNCQDYQLPSTLPIKSRIQT